jgi:hypothetical protein
MLTSQVTQRVCTVEEPSGCPLNIKILNSNIKVFKAALEAYFLVQSCSVAEMFSTEKS